MTAIFLTVFLLSGRSFPLFCSRISPSRATFNDASSLFGSSNGIDGSNCCRSRNLYETTPVKMFRTLVVRSAMVSGFGIQGERVCLFMKLPAGEFVFHPCKPAAKPELYRV